MKSFIAVGILSSFLTILSIGASAQSEPLRVGVWNIEKLSATAARGFPETSLPPRTDEELEAIADYIANDVRADALMITEIDADAPESTDARPQSAQLNQICDHLGPNWQYFLGRTGGRMRLGLLFNNQRVQLKKLVNLPADPFVVTEADVFDRDPFIVWISALDGGQPRNDLILICLHLKSIQDRFRNNRMAAVAKLLGDFTDSQTRGHLSLPGPGEEPEVLILGDCNDASFKLPKFKYMFDYLNGVGFTHLKPASGSYPDTRVNGSQIDHIFASQQVLNHSMAPGSFKVHLVPQSERDDYRQTFSDHFPVTIDVVDEADPDSTLAEIAALPDATERAERMAVLEEAAGQQSAAAEVIVDDEAEVPIEVQAEVIDTDFNRILAPNREVTPSTDLAARAAAHIADESVAAPAAAGSRRNLIVPADISHVKTLPQNWTDAEAAWFYGVPQGSKLLPYSWLVKLEQAGSQDAFTDARFIAKLGFLPRSPDSTGNPDGLPIGFAKDAHVDAVGLTCAACHTNQINYQGTALLVDGAPTLANVSEFLAALEAALVATAGNDAKFDRFAAKVLSNPTPVTKQLLRAKMHAVIAERAGYNARNMPATAAPKFGPGRIDAFGAILNEVTVRFVGLIDNHRAADAPVSYPFLWDTPHHDFVQWNGAAPNNRNVLLAPILGTSDIGALGRNSGEVLGVFGELDVSEESGLLGGYASSIDKENLIAIEESLRDLWSPKWPADFPPLDSGKVAAGKTLYANHCKSCHAIIQRTDEDREVVAEMGAVGTDQAMARNFAVRIANTGPLEDRRIGLLGLARFGASASAKDVLEHAVQRAVVGPAVHDAADSQVIGTAVDDFQFTISAEVKAPQASLEGRFESLQIIDDKVETLRGGQNVRIVEDGQDYSMSIDEESGLQIQNAAGETVDAERVRPFEVSAGLNGATVSGVAEQVVEFQYKARPLNGIWATAPYLHNGSVPSLRQLLQPPASRKARFHVGEREFDPAEVGFKYGQGAFELDTTLPGNSNQGHDYGTALSEPETAQLLEYLKSL